MKINAAKIAFNIDEESKNEKIIKRLFLFLWRNFISYLLIFKLVNQLMCINDGQ